MTDDKKIVSDKVAYYSLVSDAYKTKHRIRYKMFKWILQHMEQHVGEDITIWILMQEVRSNRV